MKRALTFTPPSQRAAKLASERAAKQAKSATNKSDVRAVVPKAPRAPAHPDNVQPIRTQQAVPSPAQHSPQAVEGVSVVVKDHEAVLVLGALLDARDKALKGAEAASAGGREAEADQLLAKSVALENLCERLGRAFVERRMAATKKT